VLCKNSSEEGPPKLLKLGTLPRGCFSPRSYLVKEVVQETQQPRRLRGHKAAPTCYMALGARRRATYLIPLEIPWKF
jgi:hypothetical protein